MNTTTRRPGTPGPTPRCSPIATAFVVALAALAVSTSALVTPLQAQQQHEHGQHASPYSDLLEREIKALSQQDAEGLLGGMGMQMALAAELNGYPGPRHVLDMGEMLELTEEQRSRVQAIFDRMQTEARTLGAEIVELERSLDAAFVGGTVDDASLEALVSEIARARGALRIAHLRAHLEVYPVLTDDQRAHYRMARGYGR